MRRAKTRHVATLLLLQAIGVLLAPAACSRRTLGVFLDIPPAESPKPVQPSPRPSAGVSDVRVAAPLADTAAAPPFERHLDPDSARSQLPRDHAGNVDWVAAMKKGIIRPRAALPGRPAPDTSAFRFLYDFYFQGPDTLFDAWFPHSIHTEWLNCQQCHARIFPYRGAAMRMSDILLGKYCAECHAGSDALRTHRAQDHATCASSGT